MFRPTWILVLLLSLCFAWMERADAEEIGYIEHFALSADRAEALKQLVPGTEDYYYFHCLYYQQTEQFAKVPALLKLWIARHGETARAREILNRQALLTYPKSPQESLKYLAHAVGAAFQSSKGTPERETQPAERTRSTSHFPQQPNPTRVQAAKQSLRL